jgi:oxygen-dependent protoporphyrinogen oxidase
LTDRVVIAGGGITGLVAAHRLLEREPGLDLALLEAAGRAGGTLGSETVSGFVFERGPNGFSDADPSTLDLARGLGLGERLIESGPLARRRYLLKRGKLHALPSGPLGLLASPLLSIAGRLRLLSEPLHGPASPDVEESVAGFGRRRLGREATSTFLDPFVTGVYAGDVERLSMASAFPRVAALEREHGSILRGLLARARARRKERPGASAAGLPGKLHSFRGGLEELAAALLARLGPRARLDSPVEAVRRKGTGYEVVLRDGTALAARAVVAALPAPRAANLFSSWNADLATALEEIPYAPVAVVCLGYARDQVEHSLEGFGFLVPRDQGLRTLGAIWVSSVFPDHAPAGAVSIRVLLGGARDPEVVGLSEGELRATVLAEVGPVLGIRGEPAAGKVYRYPVGIPQYNVGHDKRLRRIDGWLRSLPGLFITGNAYRGVGLNDCVAEAGRVAEAVLGYLGRRAAAGGPVAAPGGERE